MTKITATEFLKKLEKLNTEDLTKIKGIGNVLADNFVDFLNSNRYSKLVSAFKNLDDKGKSLLIDPVISAQQSNDKSDDKPLSGQIICITGSFELSREEIKSKLERLGAKVTDSVSKNTDILLAGQKAGSKLDKARNLGVRIVEDLGTLLPDNR